MITLFNILVNQKRGISVKEKQTAQLGNVRESYTSEYINSCSKKRKFLFIPMKIQLITINIVIPYISEINSTSSSLKKKGKRGKRKKESANEKGKAKEKEKKGIGKDKGRKRD